MPQHYNFQSNLDEEPYTYTNSCYHCGTENIIKIDQQDYDLWKIHNTNIYLVFPELNPDQRELLISGTHPTCWNEMFPEEPDDNYYLQSSTNPKQ